MSLLSSLLNRFGYDLNKKYYTRLGTRDYNPAGIDVFEADWDTLVILDACRYDTFEELSTLPGTLEKRISRGSTTNEFMKANVAGRDLRNTVYVSATPAIENDKGSATFHHIENVWQEHWNSELCTVHPEDMVEATERVIQNYPKKRVVVHFIQPHYPFIGPTGREFDYEGYTTAESEDRTPFWGRVGMGELDVSDSELQKAYEENLEITLPYVEQILETVRGKTVVTADHGEMINDRAWPIPHRVYGHPIALYTEELVHVPWLTHTNESRREIVAEDPVHEHQKSEQEIINERLEDLGYVS